MSKYIFGNFEVEFDPTDVAFVEKYEAVAESYKTKVKSVSTDDKASEILKSVCKIFFDTFDELFGKGTSEKMFGESQSVDQCVKAFKELVDIMNDYSNTLNQLTTVGVNRAVRRSKKK